MAFRAFRKRGDDRTVDEKRIVYTETGADEDRGRDYLVDEALENAVNVAMAINRPLFVTGEPGSGKTELGFAIARSVPDINHVFLFTVKSNSDAKDLFYQYDAVGRFHAAQMWRTGHVPDQAGREVQPTDVPQADRFPLHPLNFIRYRALGLALLMSHGRREVRDLLPVESVIPEAPCRSVVIIDEIDKAPQDFANDLLYEIDQYRFEVPELSAGQRVIGTPDKKPPAKRRPIIIITANSDKLPPAFLRRCVFHDIQLDLGPDAVARLDAIVGSRLRRDEMSDERAAAIMRLSVNAFVRARQLRIEPRPSIAELLDTAFVIAAVIDPGMEQGELPPLARQAVVTTLIKSTQGQALLLQNGGGELWQFGAGSITE